MCNTGYRIGGVNTVVISSFAKMMRTSCLTIEWWYRLQSLNIVWLGYQIPNFWSPIVQAFASDRKCGPSSCNLIRGNPLDLYWAKNNQFEFSTYEKQLSSTAPASKLYHDCHVFREMIKHVTMKTHKAKAKTHFYYLKLFYFWTAFAASNIHSISTALT